MVTPIIVWTKPNCVQCTAVKRRLIEASVKFEERDITAPEHVKDLEWFKSLGYLSAPITEYKKILVPGYVPAELDELINTWREDRAQALGD